MSPDAARLLAALPQTQCTRCGYPDCAAYATAIASGEAWQLEQFLCPSPLAPALAGAAELLGDDLGEHRLGALADRGRATRHVNAAEIGRAHV